MKFVTTIPLLCLFTAAWALAAAAPALRISTGRGVLASDGSPAYTERFEERFSADRLIASTTYYTDPRGNAIAQRTMDFSKSSRKPDYVLRDLRDGYEEGAELRGDSIRVFFRASRGAALKEKTMRVPEPAVVDGGFNAFLKEKWDLLLTGKPVRFNFVAPSQRDWFSFQAVLKGSAKTPDGRVTHTFAIQVDNALLRLLVKPILVTYDDATRRMTAYSGISNINGADGKSLKVRLAYPDLGP